MVMNSHQAANMAYVLCIDFGVSENGLQSHGLNGTCTWNSMEEKVKNKQSYNSAEDCPPATMRP